MPNGCAKPEKGSAVTLVDGPSFSFNFVERKGLILGQVKDADRIVISRADRISEKQIKDIRGSLRAGQKDIPLLGRMDTGSLDMLGRKILLMDEATERAT